MHSILIGWCLEYRKLFLPIINRELIDYDVVYNTDIFHQGALITGSTVQEYTVVRPIPAGL